MAGNSGASSVVPVALPRRVSTRANQLPAFHRSVKHQSAIAADRPAVALLAPIERAAGAGFPVEAA